MNSHASKSTFLTKHTSELKPKNDTNQNDPKSDPKATPESNQQKCRPGVSKIAEKGATNDTKKNPKIRKQRFGCICSAQKDQCSEPVFCLFLISLGGPGPWKPTQNVVKVCKNEEVPPFHQKP